ncbi:D-mannonate dehydratase ManD [Streptomyces albidoflavus]|uniref:D-mannonate dehydratase ManD n=1 Tax=Streptomyces TaxID=1883 RepID=UPI001FFF578C|nr:MULTISPECIES: D-mannonate dehydratase ManD [unclassified Streptomyces]MCK2145051.1 D-galactonate dehydratase family protein [Streptomyces sp. WAC00276]MCQ9704963.1 D-galactonate dehydratase family protein [Streptomyces sp. BSP1]
MRITDAQVVVTSPGRNFVTLKVTTDEGLTGLGDATLNGRELAVASYLSDHVAPLLAGLDPHRIEDTWQYLYRGAYWRRGPVTMAAVAAVDVALWDIKAQAAGLPLYQLLGGACRDRIATYGHANGRDIPELLDSVRARLAEGYPAVRVQTGVPGLRAVYGVHTTDGEGAAVAHQRARPLVEDWDTEAYLRHLPAVFEAVRAEFGPGLPLLHDAHHRLTPVQAARLGKDLEPYRPFWLEDCTPAENQEALRLVRRHTTTPLAVGEVFNTVHDYRGLITEQLIDYARSAVTHFGGVTPLRKLFDFAAQYQVKAAIHGPEDISPVGMAAALHLDLAVHNFGIQEYSGHTPLTHEVFPHAYTFSDGHLHPGETPGLGVRLDEELAAAHPYEPAYLPVNRLQDGTLHDW